MVIAAADIPRWYQPEPNLAVGDALVVLSTVLDAMGAGVAPASAAITAVFLGVVETAADAPLNYDDDLELLPLVDATAEVVFDNTAAVEDDLGVSACIALADITATCLLDTQNSGPALFVLFGIVDAAPVVSANAEIEFADYGQGSIPVFPFTLPVLFTDNPYGYQTGDAIVAVTGDGFDIQGAGFADAVVVMDTPAAFSRKGNTPIFPFGFPIVFTDPANDQRAVAVVELLVPAQLIVEVDGDAEAGITATVLQTNPAVFPMTLPVVLAA